MTVQAGSDADRVARVALNALAEPGDPRLASLVAELGAGTVREHLQAERDVAGLHTDVSARLAGLDPERDLDRTSRLGIRFVIPGDAEWPTWLGDLDRAAPVNRRGGAPLGLWVRGPARLDELATSVSVVGSRSATSYGGDVAGELGAGLVSAGYAVVSGAAFGIDQAAHRGALAGDGLTVTVLAGGVDRPYPQAHRDLIGHIARRGAVVSEAPPGYAPSKLRFLARNRLIAALSRGTVVVEAALRSGALNTANWAGLLGRAVMGVPGPVISASSQGVHELVRSGAAVLVTGTDDVLELVGRAGEHLCGPRRGPVTPRDRLPLRHRQVLDAVPVHRAARPESIARTAGLGAAEVTAALSTLRQAGLVQQSQRGWLLTAPART